MFTSWNILYGNFNQRWHSRGPWMQKLKMSFLDMVVWTYEICITRCKYKVGTHITMSCRAVMFGYGLLNSLAIRLLEEVYGNHCVIFEPITFNCLINILIFLTCIDWWLQWCTVSYLLPDEGLLRRFLFAQILWTSKFQAFFCLPNRRY